MAAVQWHPEFHRRGEGTLDDAPLLDDFLAAARAAQDRMNDALKIINPADGAPLAEVPADDAASVAAKAERARAAQPAWQATPLAKRGDRDRALSRSPSPTELETLATHADAGSRQAARAVAQRAERLARPHRLLPRRGRGGDRSDETVFSRRRR